MSNNYISRFHAAGMFLLFFFMWNGAKAEHDMYIVDDSNPGIVYAHFSARSIGERYMGTMHESDNPNASFEITFSGPVIELIADVISWGGNASVYIDGVPAGSISYNSDNAASQQVVYYNDTLSQGEHIIRVEHAGPEDYWIYLDAYRHASGVYATEKPAAPESFRAEALSSTEVKLSWADMSGTDESFFLIERSEDGVNYPDTIAMAEANSVSFSDVTVISNRYYYYRLSAVNGAGLSDYQYAEVKVGGIVGAYPLYKVDDTNQGISYENFVFHLQPGRFMHSIHESEHPDAAFEFSFSGNVIELIGEVQSWGGVGQVYIDGEPAGTMNCRGTGGIGQVVYYNDALSDGKHHIRVTHQSGGYIYLDAYRHGSGNNADQPPDAPADFSAETISSTQIRLSWEPDPEQQVAYYWIGLSDAEKSYVDTIFLEANTTSYLVENLRHHKEYAFKICAVNLAGKSEYSTVAAATMLLTESEVWADDFHSDIKYNGWKPLARDNRYLGTESETNNGSHYFKYQFLGTRVEIIAGLVPFGGTGRVYINGAQEGTARFQGNSDPATAYKSGSLPLQRHSVMMLHTSGWSYLDALKYYSEGEEPDPALNWPYAFASNDTVIYAGDPIELRGMAYDTDGEIVKSTWDMVHTTRSNMAFHAETDIAVIDSLPTGFYHLRYMVTDNDGLEAYDVIRLRVITNPFVSVSPMAEHDAGLRVFPNPGNGIMSFEHNLAGRFSVVVFNSRGQVVQAREFNGNESGYSLDMSNELPGIYFMRIGNNETTMTEKIMIVR